MTGMIDDPAPMFRRHDEFVRALEQLHASWVAAEGDARRYGEIVDWLRENMPRALELCPYKLGESVSREARDLESTEPTGVVDSGS